MTVQQAHQAVGKWAAKKPGNLPVIIIKVAGTAVTARDAGDRGARGAKSHYGIYPPDWLTRREDWDGRRLPNWLQDAIDKYRSTGKVAADLHDAVMAHVAPQYTSYALTPEDVRDEAIYRSYVAQRRHSPDVAPERWSAVFDNVEALEQRYQEERADELPLVGQTHGTGVNHG